MVEIKFCGRGGQGVVIASQILAKVYFLMGKYPQCFALFGGERRGAPVTSFLRVDEKKIYVKCEIKRPHRMMYFAPDLINESEVDLKPLREGFVLINTPLSIEHFTGLRKFPVALVNATAIAAEQGVGTAINATMLGGYCRVAGDVSVDILEEAIRTSVPAKVEENLKAARQAFEMTRMFPGEGK